MKQNFSKFLPLLILGLILFWIPTLAIAEDRQIAGQPWWIWPILLFGLTFFIGVGGVMAGIGGGVLFVPLVSGFFPFHIDFVRGAGLMIALGSSLAAAPNLLKTNVASLKLALPAALIASGFSIIGALSGLWLSQINPAYIQISLGILIFLIVLLMLFSSNTLYPEVKSGNILTEALELNGVFYEPTLNRQVSWSVHRTAKGLTAFSLSGFLSGMFGLGAGWANVPIFNLIMGAPLKISVATSSFALSITDTTAIWIYFNQGAILPIIVIPSLAGVMIGGNIGGHLLPKVDPSQTRKFVIGILALAAFSSLLKGIWIVI